MKEEIKNIQNPEHDYLQHIDRPNLYIDISNSINKKFYYNITNVDDSLINKNIVTNIIENISCQKELYLLVSNLLLSKDYSQLILNNFDVLKMLSCNKYFYNKFNCDTNFIEKYIIMFKYCIGYAWITYYMEETLKKTYICEEDRFVFDINTASLLPYFPFKSLYPKTSPYFTLLVDDEIINYENNNLTFWLY